MKQKKFSIGIFMFLANAVTLSIGFLAIVIFGIYALREVTNRQTHMNLHVFTEIICLYLESETSKTETAHNLMQTDLNMLTKQIASEHPKFRITIVNRDGNVVADSSVVDISVMENHSDRIEVIDALNGKFGHTTRKSSSTGIELIYYSMPLELFGKKYAVRISVPASLSAYHSSNIRWKTVFIVAIIFALIAIVSFAVEIKIAKYIQKLETVRKNFVENVSHELKTPVTSIKGFSETLLDTPDVDACTALHFLEIIHSQSTRLMCMIDDLLTLAYLEHDGKPPEMVMCNVTEIVTASFHNFSEQAKSKNINMAITSDNSNVETKMNARLVEQAIGNIIDNAVKYCPANSEISCHISSTPNTVQIAIEDNGNGIPEKYRERIFERFFRVDKGRSRENGGTGLGLSITMHIVEIHGGTVIATTRLDGKNGSRFVIELPLATGSKLLGTR